MMSMPPESKPPSVPQRDKQGGDAPRRPAGASTNHGHSAAHGKAMRCTTKLVAGPVKFTTTGAATRAVLSRAGTVEATGIVSGRGGRTLLLNASRRLKAGRYTLSLAGRHGRRTSTVTIS